jgi:regulator of sigma E protease
MASLGLPWLIHLIGLLSVGIGLVNLFPIPMLDGGHLMFYAIEAVRQRPLSERAQEIGFRVGLAFVLMLTVFVTVGDVRRILNIF